MWKERQKRAKREGEVVERKRSERIQTNEEQMKRGKIILIEVLY